MYIDGFLQHTALFLSEISTCAKFPEKLTFLTPLYAQGVSGGKKC